MTKGPESREIKHHAWIGGAIAFALTIVHFALENWAPRATYLELVAAVPVALIAFWVVFWAIVFLELRLRRPILMRDVGEIDGYWVYAMRDVDDVDFSRGSILYIESFGTTFRMKGWSYERRNPGSYSDQFELAQEGEFWAGGVAWTQRRVHYSYYGKENDVDDSGVGYYSFGENGAEFTIAGRFTGSSLGEDCKTATRFLVGRRMRKGSERDGRYPPTVSARSELIEGLRAELVRCSRDQRFGYCFEHAGPVDGYWLDAIFAEKNGGWTVIEGSVIRIRSSSEAKRFRVEGWTYIWEKLKAAHDPERVEPPYSFRGDGRPMRGVEGFYYHYAGFAEGQEGGAGEYLFYRDDADRLSFTGAFMRRLGVPHRLVYGRKMDENEWPNRAKHLKELLADCERELPPGLASLRVPNRSGLTAG